jgi:hypothetical protein
MVIQSLYLPHTGGSYVYKVHVPKIRQLCTNGLGPLHDFLQRAFVDCPHAYFNGGPRGSNLKYKIPVELVELRGHEVSTLARLGLEQHKDAPMSNHSKVQYFMLENDTATIGIEVPLWMTFDEHRDFVQLFRSIQPMTGHIDVLRIEDGKIWVWDYKPDSHREKYAATQVYFYSVMLSARTGLPLEHFRCGYFDSSHAYLFKPADVSLAKDAPLHLVR